MTGKIQFDDKAGKVISAELDVNYAGLLAAAEKELVLRRNDLTRVERALKTLGITNRPLKEADHKKLASTPNAAALIKEFQQCQLTAITAINAHGQHVNDLEAAEGKAVNELFKSAGKKTAERMDEIDKSIKDLKAELGKLEDLKKGLLDQIKKATEARSAEYRKKYSAIFAEAKAMKEDYNLKNWDFGLTLAKYMKK